MKEWGFKRESLLKSHYYNNGSKLVKIRLLPFFLSMKKRTSIPILFSIFFLVSVFSPLSSVFAQERCAKNLSVEYPCAEEDNICIPFWGYTSSYRVIATFPEYYPLELGTKERCEPDWRGWVPHPPPHTTYYDATNHRLLYSIRGLGTSGDWWRKPLILDDDGDVGKYLSRGEVSRPVRIAYTGEPAYDYVWPGGADSYVVYYKDVDANNGELRCVFEAEETGGVWSEPMVLDSDGDVGKFTSIVLEVESKATQIPHIVYYDATNGNLKYITKPPKLRVWAKDYDSSTGGIEKVEHIGTIPGYTIRSLGSGSATYNISFSHTYKPPEYISIQYADDIGGAKVDVYLDGEYQGGFTSRKTASPMVITKEAEGYLEEYSSGVGKVWRESASSKQTIKGRGEAVYKVDFAAGIENLNAEFICIGYTDDIGGGQVKVYLDDVLQTTFTTQKTATPTTDKTPEPNAYKETEKIALVGDVRDSGSHVLKLMLLPGSSHLEVDYIRIIGGLKFVKSPLIFLKTEITQGTHPIKLKITPNSSNLEIEHFLIGGWLQPEVIDY